MAPTWDVPVLFIINPIGGIESESAVLTQMTDRQVDSVEED